MNEMPLLTKNCLDPWKNLFFSPDGSLYPCCASPLPDGDFGNIKSIDPGKLNTNDSKKVFSGKAYKNLRQQLLEGNLQKACRECRVVAEEVSIEQLCKRVENHLRYGGIDLSESTDLANEYYFTDCLTNVTDKCNFSCIYCFVHSNDKLGEGMKNYIEFDREHFVDLISFLVENGLEYLTFCGIGELTVYPHWKDICREIFNRYPKMRISLVSNFGRKFSDEDLDVLSRFFEIRISCDTMDPEKYAWLRRGGRLPVLIDNINNLRARFKPGSAHPRLIFIVTESDAILSGLTELARFAVKRNISIYMSNRAPVEDSVATVTGCLGRIADLPEPQILDAWEIIHDLPRRARAEHPPIDYFCDMGPLYNTVRQQAESITFNRFVPSEKELVYKSFAAAQPKNPDIYLRKFFLTFDECIKGIFIKSGLTVDVPLPYRTGILEYRPILCKEVAGRSLRIFIGYSSKVAVGSAVTFSAKECPKRYTHVLFEILSYEPCSEDHPVTKFLDSSTRFSSFSQLVTVGEFPDQRYEFAMKVSDFLRSSPQLHKLAESVYRQVLRLHSRIKSGILF